MGKHDALSKGLAIAGVALAAIPILAPVMFSVRTFTRPGGYMIDYLMPFELAPVTWVGMALLLWASRRARLRWGATWTSIAVYFGGVLAGAASAKLTGIADSVETLETWRYAVTIAFGVLALAGQIALVVVGCLIVRDLFAKSAAAATAEREPEGT